jgi:hypothetical protein
MNQLAAFIVALASGEAEGDPATEPKPEKPVDPTKNPNAVALGRLGGQKGGKARAASLTPEQRSEIAKKAAAKRWQK